MLCSLFFLGLLESSGRHGKAPNAFIFSLNNFERLAPFVSKVKPGKTQIAIDRDAQFGPKFGTDLVIYLDLGSIGSSKAGLGNYYSVPSSVKDEDKDKVLKGPGKKFSPDEVEVFYLDSTH